jgi:chemotaxis protein MotA
MKAITAIGIGFAIVAMLVAATMEGTSIPAFFVIPAYIVVFAGTLGATMAGTSMERIKLIPSLYKIAFSPPEMHFGGRVKELVGFAEQARRDGLLALDEAVNSINDPFTKKGVQLVVDGTDPDLVAAVLDAENEAMRKRHGAARNPFMQAGALAPTMGIIGTVFGLVNVMNNLNQPSTLGPLIASAFLATLMGVGSANVVFLPVANRLKELSEAELHFREMTLEGILAIQAGDNPRVVEEKLMAYVPPKDRPTDESKAADAAAQKQAA